jgi:DNA repair protein RadA/Sms
MAKPKKEFVCQQCGFSNSKWLGKCPNCQQWETFILEERSEESGSSDQKPVGSVFFHDLDQIQPAERAHRLSTGIAELDRVLGGGLVSDSFVLLGGDPGIGKSTILLQLAKGLIQKHDLRILYVSGEESASQIQSRALRLGLKSDGHIFLSSLTDLDQCIECIRQCDPDLVMMDSLQTFCSQAIGSSPGSVSQVREIAHRLMFIAKSQHICVWLVGHVTKEGSIAGPKMVEHMVDTVLYFEGESSQSYRLLRAVKNRFGSARELGVFDMTEKGLLEVSNPSSFFLSERKSAAAGTAICCLMEGTRALLVECQALLVRTYLSIARRTAVGIDPVRVTMLCAILEKHLSLNLAECDLFFNIAGGLKIHDPACDLAVSVAIWSSLMNEPIPLDWVFIGELGLTSEVRRVTQLEARIDEASRLGFKKICIPASEKTVCIDKKAEIIGITHAHQIPSLFSR